jgi:hypothetical protein
VARNYLTESGGNMSKQKKCNHCKKPYSPISSLAKACSWECAIELTRGDTAKKERKAMRERKQALKTRSDWLREAQTAFNWYIRERDHDQVCISCQKPPKKRNAGHYRSVGACPELRFCEENVHLQCEHCNTHLSSNAIEYRINLVKRLGVERVEWIEGPHDPAKYTIEDAKDIKKKYNGLARELKQKRESAV